MPLAGVGAKNAPLRISGCVVWWNYAKTSTIADTAGAVGAVTDWAGTGTNQLANVSPTTGTRTQNSLNVIDFDGTDDYMSSSSITLAQPFTIYIVVKSDDGADSADQRFLAAASTTLACGKGTTNAWRISCGTALVGTSSTVDANFHYLTFVCNGGSSAIRLDGAAYASGNAGTNGFSAEAIRVGRTNGAGTQYWDGCIGEVLIYNTAHGATEFAVIEDYLDGKWAI